MPNQDQWEQIVNALGPASRHLLETWVCQFGGFTTREQLEDWGAIGHLTAEVHRHAEDGVGWWFEENGQVRIRDCDLPILSVLLNCPR